MANNPLYDKITENWPQFLILPGRRHGDVEYPDLLVSSRRERFGGQGWASSHSFVQHEGDDEEVWSDPATTITLRQFVDFANMLRSDKVYTAEGKLLGAKIREEMVRETLEGGTGEFFNSRLIYQVGSFPFRRRKVHLIHYSIGENSDRFKIDGTLMVFKSELSEVQTKLKGYLARPDSIDLNEWLQRATPEGLPPKRIGSGNLIYRPPIGFGSIMLFKGSHGGNYNQLDCGVNSMLFQSPDIGIRKVMIKP